MKPIMLPKPAIKFPFHEDCIKFCKERQHLGEIGSDTLDPSLDNIRLFFDHLWRCGYKRRECNHYDSLSLTYVNGSAGWHEDPGFGVVACWLLYSDNDLFKAELITRHGSLQMAPGDLCIFNADKGHAWLSNGVCVMVMATVRRIRKCQ